MEASDLEHFKFSEISFHRYDSKGITAIHCKQINYRWPYFPTIDEKECKVNNFYNVAKVVDARKGMGSSHPLSNKKLTNKESSPRKENQGE